MTASGKRPADVASSLSRETEELDRIAGMNDDELALHLADSGVDVAALDEHVDSVRGQVESIRGPIVAAAIAAYESSPDMWKRSRLDSWPAPPPAGWGRRRTLTRLLAVCMVALFAILGGAALASLLR
jgi:hypothetical protein